MASINSWVSRDVTSFVQISVRHVGVPRVGLDTNIAKNVLNFFLEILIKFLNFFWI